MAKIAVSLIVDEVDFYVQNLFTRFPFQYGIADLTAMPHLFLRVRMRVERRPIEGVCGEHLPPKWFTKNPDTSFEEDLPDLLRVVTHAADLAKAIGSGRFFFELWQELYQQQAEWAEQEGLAPLLANLGVSMVERALIDGVCRLLQKPFHQVLLDDQLGIDLGLIHEELSGVPIADVVKEEPLQEVMARHTVGLGDTLRVGDLSNEQQIQDGLPISLDQCIEAYGLRYFKIKLRGDLEHDRARLLSLTALFQEMLGDNYQFTIDGNENFKSVAQFIKHWDAYHEDDTLRAFMGHLLFVEQPLHRDVALAEDVKQGLSGWVNRPPMIIDESDATLESLPCALDLGYNGTSFKSCKGIVKGLANAALLVKQKEAFPEQEWILSGEDLCTVGPLQLLQDLCLMASLGVTHVERNGHHYVKGLSAFPEIMQGQIQAAHTDLYEWRSEGYTSLRLRGGKLSTVSVSAQHFGVGPALSMDQFTPLNDWKVTSILPND